MTSRFCKVLLLAALIASSLPAGMIFTFESPYTGTAGGTSITGQDGWYTPVVGSVDGQVFTYSGNVPGIASNPTGGDQFAGTIAQGGTAFGRAQQAFDHSSASVWDIAFDVAARNTNPDFSENNVGSFSLQDTTAGTAALIVLASWTNPGDASSTWQFGYQSNSGDPQPGFIPGAAWTGLAQNNWYRTGFTVDFATGQLISAWITNLSTGNTASFVFSNFFLGAGLTVDAFRLFGGGSTAGNVAAWDNISFDGSAVPEPITFLTLGCGLAALALLRRRR